MTKYSKNSAAAAGLANCLGCGLVSPVEKKQCPRCHAPLNLRKPYSLQLSLALLITAFIIYIPANLVPIMITEKLAKVEYVTILGGIIELWQDGSEPIAVVVFVASVLVPIIKFIILFLLYFSVRFAPGMSITKRMMLFKLTHLIGRWSMVDIFVMAVLVALIQMNHFLSVLPGGGAIAFAAVIILTIFAANSFDPRILWDNLPQSDVDENK
ncbi:MAG: paraquat-inducible protein A [Psychrobium sp.]|nr:paraquat-inducible protein A [Psychrobium sp.]